MTDRQAQIAWARGARRRQAERFTEDREFFAALAQAEVVREWDAFDADGHVLEQVRVEPPGGSRGWLRGVPVGVAGPAGAELFAACLWTQAGKLRWFWWFEVEPSLPVDDVALIAHDEMLPAARPGEWQGFVLTEPLWERLCREVGDESVALVRS